MTERVTITWGGRTLTLETGRLAKQANGAVLVTYGESVVLVSAVTSRTPREGRDFFPLTVDYQEMTYAAGKIPVGFFKREGRPSEKEVLTSRFIDRPLRPLFRKTILTMCRLLPPCFLLIAKIVEINKVSWSKGWCCREVCRSKNTEVKMVKARLVYSH